MHRKLGDVRTWHTSIFGPPMILEQKLWEHTGLELPRFSLFLSVFHLFLLWARNKVKFRHFDQCTYLPVKRPRQMLSNLYLSLVKALLISELHHFHWGCKPFFVAFWAFHRIVPSKTRNISRLRRGISNLKPTLDWELSGVFWSSFLAAVSNVWLQKAKNIRFPVTVENFHTRSRKLCWPTKLKTLTHEDLPSEKMSKFA